MIISELEEIGKVLDNTLEYLETELKDINVGLREEKKTKEHYRVIYDKIGNTISDLSLFFYTYPQLMKRIKRAGLGMDRNMRPVYENAEKSLRETYYSYVALKDLVISLERIVRPILYQFEGIG